MRRLVRSLLHILPAFLLALMLLRFNTVLLDGAKADEFDEFVKHPIVSAVALYGLLYFSTGRHLEQTGVAFVLISLVYTTRSQALVGLITGLAIASTALLVLFAPDEDASRQKEAGMVSAAVRTLNGTLA